MENTQKKQTTMETLAITGMTCANCSQTIEKTLNKFLEANLWDEANVIVGEKNFGKGVKAPIISQGLVSMENIGGDILKIYHNQKKL